MSNILTAPPETVFINNKEYAINTDYRVCLSVIEILENIHEDIPIDDFADKLVEVMLLLLGEVLVEDLNAVFEAIKTFLSGYPKEAVGGGGTNGTANFSFKYDINYIILAIRNQSGIDLSYTRQEPFHWWDFLMEFESLTEEHFISKIIGFRSYTGKDPELLKLKAAWAIPTVTAQQREEIADIFYNC